MDITSIYWKMFQIPQTDSLYAMNAQILRVVDKGEQKIYAINIIMEKMKSSHHPVT